MDHVRRANLLPTILGSCIGILIFALIAGVNALSGGMGQVDIRHVGLLSIYVLGPWVLFNHFTALLITLALRRLSLVRLWQYFASALLVWIVFAVAPVAYLLQEQKNCDSVCLGLEEPVVFSIPLYAVIIGTSVTVGLIQGYTFWRCGGALEMADAG